MEGPRGLWSRLTGLAQLAMATAAANAAAAAKPLAAWARRAAAAALTAPGRPVPRHIAFILDGNRRYAEARQLRKVEGHAFGYRRLIDALDWCLQLGVRCVSVYAFSIDNYRRSAEEVGTLMALAEEKLAHMLQEHEVLAQHGVQVRVIGDLSLAPATVQAAAQRIMAATAHHDQAVLNLCFSYTASEELHQALDRLAPGCPTSSRSSTTGDRAPALDAALYTAGCPPVDLLVRTSGETRLSDFLLWQCRHALLVFTGVLWPDFGFLDLVEAVMAFQRQATHLRRLQAAAHTHAAVQPEPAPPRPSSGSRAAQDAAGGAAGDVPATSMVQQLAPVKLARRAQGSPCYVASPASPSSPSSKSDDAASDTDGGGPTLLAWPHPG